MSHWLSIVTSAGRCNYTYMRLSEGKQWAYLNMLGGCNVDHTPRSSFRIGWGLLGITVTRGPMVVGVKCRGKGQGEVGWKSHWLCQWWWRYGLVKVCLLEGYGAKESLFVGEIWGISRRPVWVWLSCFCAFKKWPAVFCDCISVWLGRIEHLHRPSSRAMIFLVFCSMEAFKSMLSCLTSHQSFFSSVMTAVRLFDCSTLNWPNSTWTQALYTVSR